MKLSVVLTIAVLTSMTLSAQPIWKWVVPLTGPQTDEVNALAISSANVLHVAGTFSDSLNIGGPGGIKIPGIFQYDAFTASFTKAGVPRTAGALGGLDADESRSVVVDNQGNIYVAGSFIDSAQIGPWIVLSEGSSSDMFVAKYDKNGASIWAKSFGSADYDENSPYLAVDSLGNVYMGGGVGGIGKFQSKEHVSQGKADAFVVKLTSAGEVTWLAASGGPQVGHVRSISVSPNGDRIYTTGIFAGQADFPLLPSLTAFGSTTDYFVWALNANGGSIWAKRIGSGKPDNNIAGAVDRDGKLVVTGSFSGATNFDTQVVNANGEFETDVFLTRFAKDGKIDFVKKWGGVYGEVATCVFADKQGGIYIGGYYDSASIFDQTVLEPFGERDAFIARCESDGSLEWIREAGGPHADEIRGIAIGIDNVPYAAGVFDASANFSGITIVGERYSDGFVAALECGPNTRLRPALKTLNICEGQDSTIFAPGAYPSYLWYVDGVATNNGSSKFRLGTLPLGEHTLLVAIRDRYDCQKSSDTIRVTVRPGLDKPSITKQGNKLVTDAVAYLYQWFREGVAIPGATSTEVPLTLDGLYQVRIMDTGGCSRASDAYLHGTTDVTDPGVFAGISVYPNPTQSNLNIRGLVGECEIAIVNNLGIVMYTGTHADEHVALDLASFSVGTYTVTIRSGQQTTAYRVVRQ
ncbi:MAG: T9SS type A sorting domain-containing protein [bacterium]|nr:T9SS type A sorting domain-containing protein [bacterium]